MEQAPGGRSRSQTLPRQELLARSPFLLPAGSEHVFPADSSRLDRRGDPCVFRSRSLLGFARLGALRLVLLAARLRRGPDPVCVHLPPWVGGLPFSLTPYATMTVARVTEISASSKKSFARAIEKGVERACQTLNNVEGAWVKDQRVVIRKGKIREYRVLLKITFVLND